MKNRWDDKAADEAVRRWGAEYGEDLALRLYTARLIGREALEAQKAEGVSQQLVGWVLEGRGILRPHQKVLTARGEGETTSGTLENG